MRLNLMLLLLAASDVESGARARIRHNGTYAETENRIS